MTDEEARPIGATLDALGVTISLTADQQVTEAIVIAKITDFESGSTALGMYHSDGLDWIGQLGLLTAGRYAMEGVAIVADEDDE